MQVSVVLSLILIYFMGISLLFFLTDRKLHFLEWIGLAFPLGLFQLCLSVILLDMIGPLLWNPWLWLMEILLCAVWSMAGFKKHQRYGGLRKIFSFEKSCFTPKGINALFLVVLAFVCYIGWMNFYNTLYYPTYDADGKTAFDVVGYIMAQEHTLRNLSIFQAAENPLIHNPGSCIGYTPLLQISYAYVYWAGAQTSKSIVALLFVSMMFVVYGAGRRSMGKTAAILLVFAIISTPKLLECSSYSLTNVMHSVFSTMGVIYSLLWLNSKPNNEDRVFFKKISCILLAASIMVRIEGFVVPAVIGLILLWVVIVRKKHIKFYEIMLWGLGVLTPFIVWSLYQKIAGLSTESFFIARPFWDVEKAKQIAASFKKIFFYRLSYGFVFVYALAACLASIGFVYKKKDNSYGYFILFGAMFLYGLTLYHVDYVWDSLDRVLADSAMRFFLIFVPIAWYSIFTCYPVRWFFDKTEQALSFKTIFTLSPIVLIALPLFSCQGEMVERKTEITHYQQNELKPGDYYYSDGTWSDGGLREKTDKSMVVETPKPLPLPDKKVVGIVFQTDTSRIGCREKEFLKSLGVSRPRGLVMAVECTDKGTAYAWVGWNRKMGFITETSMKECFLDVEGLAATEKYENLYPESSAIVAIINQNKKDSVQQKQTPWFVPSTGQWWDILQNLGGADVLNTEKARNETMRGAFFWNKQYDICDHLNFWMQGVPEEEKDLFGSQYDHYWSSSEFNKYRQRYIGIINNEGYLYMDWNSTGFHHKIRCILAF